MSVVDGRMRDSTRSLLVRLSPAYILGATLILSGYWVELGAILIGLSLFPFVFIRVITTDFGGFHPL